MHPCPRDASVLCLGLASLPKGCVSVWSGLAKRVGRRGSNPSPERVWSGLVWSGAQGCFGHPIRYQIVKRQSSILDNFAPIPNCKKTELRLGYRACQSIGTCIVTPWLTLQGHSPTCFCCISAPITK